MRWVCANISIVFGPQVALRTFAAWKCSKYKTTTVIGVTATTIDIFIAHEIGFLCMMEGTQRETLLPFNWCAICEALEYIWNLLTISDLQLRHIERSKANRLAFNAFLEFPLFLTWTSRYLLFRHTPSCLLYSPLSLSVCYSPSPFSLWLQCRNANDKLFTSRAFHSQSQSMPPPPTKTQNYWLTRLIYLYIVI